MNSFSVCVPVAEAQLWGCEGADLQTGQERSDPISNRWVEQAVIYLISTFLLISNFPQNWENLSQKYTHDLSIPVGVILRDSHGVAQVRFVTGNKILRILKAKGLAANIPEDLYHLIKKAVAIRKHLERNRKVRVTT